METTTRTIIALDFVNASKGHRFGSEVVECDDDDRGTIFRNLRSEYGRCTGKVYRDLADGGSVAVGWCFIQRRPYEDSRSFPPETYLHETWAEVRNVVTTNA